MNTGPKRWPHLFAPLQLGPLTLPNRIVMPAMDPSLADAEGRITAAFLRHYVDRAAGGAGLVVTGNIAVSPRGRLSPYMAMLADNAALPGFHGLCHDVHAVGGRIFLQLSHAGRQTLSQFCDGQPLSASNLPCPVMREPPRAMTEAEIEETIEAFAAAARRAQLAGADGVEIHMAHGYLVCQFLSPYSNLRTDAWGGDTNGRVRFAVEIVRRIRGAVGPDYPVQCRLSADERVEGGITPELAAEHAVALVDAGATSLSISACNYESYRYNMPAYYLPEATYASLARGVRQHLAAQGRSVPVVAVGRFRRPELAEDVLARGDADLIGMGRALIADPDLPRHLLAGEPEAVRPCLSCNRCAESVTLGGLRCLVNPDAGRPPDVLAPPSARRTVLVIGGGPAGATAAVEAARRGHDVRLVEAGPRLGGKLWASAAPPEKAAFAEYAAWLVRSVEKAGVKVELNHAWTVAEIRSAPEAVILVATGAEPLALPDVPGLAAHPGVCHPEAALADQTPRRHVVVLGGGPEGCEVADTFAHRPERPRVTLIERRPKVGLGLPSSVRALLQARLEAAGVFLMTGRTLATVEADALTLVDRRGRPAETLAGADLIAICIGVRSPELDETLRGDARLHLLGDAREAATILEAVSEGQRIARSL